MITGIVRVDFRFSIIRTRSEWWIEGEVVTRRRRSCIIAQREGVGRVK